MLLQETHDLAAAGGTEKNCFYKAQENTMSDNICSYQAEIKILGYIINFSSKARLKSKKKHLLKVCPVKRSRHNQSVSARHVPSFIETRTISLN